jgi:hypothetical protein
MHAKIDVMEREWKNLEFGVYLNKAQVRTLQDVGLELSPVAH